MTNNRRKNATSAGRAMSATNGGAQVNQAQATPGKNHERNVRRRQLRRERMAALTNSIEQVTNLSNVPNATRTGVTPNPADPRTTQKMLANTPSGAQWVLKVLHPNGENNHYVPKVPDGSASESVVLERRDEFNIAIPSEMTTDTWTLVIVQMPTLCKSLVAVAGETDELTQDAVRMAVQNAMQSPQAAGGNWPNWNNTGTLHWTRCRMTTLDVETTDIQVAENLFKSVRRTYCGLTCDFDAADLTNKGRVTTGQFQNIAETRTFDVTAPDAGTVDAFVVNHPPYVINQIVQEDLKNRQALAKTGDYIPMRIWQPTIPFVSSSQARIVSDPISFNPALDHSDYPLNIWFDGWGSSVQRWEDIHRTSSIRIKRREGLEFVTGVNSPYGPFASIAFSDDDKAIKVAREFARTEPHSYEADFNDKNKMATSIIGGLGNALGNLGIPIVSDLAPVLGGILGKLLPF
jgi:hypothetical protein